MSPVIVTIICAVLGSAGVFGFVSFLIQRHDQRHAIIEEIRKQHEEDVEMLRDERDEQIREVHRLLCEIKEQNARSERDSVRTQLLVLMTDYPDDVSEILHCAEHYFKDLDGNWYATTLFTKFLREKGLTVPEWLLNK